MAGGDYAEHLWTPQDFGYEDHIAPLELAAEGFRAYMADPNYVKMALPLFAAYVQDLVNSHPGLRRLIQFNTLLLAAGAAAGAVHDGKTDEEKRANGSL